jgi:anti-sigma factor RsiW
MKCTQTLEVGAYVLGALVPAEREAFERHLAECAICRDEVADLAVLPGLLGRLDFETARSIAQVG